MSTRNRGRKKVKFNSLTSVVHCRYCRDRCNLRGPKYRYCPYCAGHAKRPEDMTANERFEKAVEQFRGMASGTEALKGTTP